MKKNYFSKNRFGAILAKNDIAREIKNYLNYRQDFSINIVLGALRDIEAYLGEANQPNITSIVNSKIDI